MDSDLWTSRLAATKRHYMLQHQQSSQLDRLNIDDFEVEEEGRPDFPCPYCYEEYDIASLCSHLEDEHPFESKVAVCSICSVKVSRDMLGHITLQHGHLFKLQRCRRLRRVAFPNSQALSLMGRDLREAHLQVLLGGGGYRSSNANASNAVMDSLLSSLVLNFPASEADEISKSLVSSAEDTSVKSVTSTKTWKSSFDSSLSYEEREQKMKEATVRAGFMQDLLLCTLFGDQGNPDGPQTNISTLKEAGGTPASSITSPHSRDGPSADVLHPSNGAHFVHLSAGRTSHRLLKNIAEHLPGLCPDPRWVNFKIVHTI